MTALTFAGGFIAGVSVLGLAILFADARRARRVPVRRHPTIGSNVHCLPPRSFDQEG